MMSDNNAAITMPVQPMYGGYGRNCGGMGGWGDNWIMWIVLALILGVFGGFGGFGFGGGGGYGAQQGYDTRAEIQRSFDTQTVVNKLNGLENGLCDGFYAQNTNMLTGFNGVQNTLAQGFAGTNTTFVQQGYENRLASQALGAQMAQSYGDIRAEIQANTTQGVMNTNAIQQDIQKCCCDNEKIAMQNRFDAQQYNCNTLQAIDKLGDRLEARLTAQELAAKDARIAELTSINNALNLAQSQANQTNEIRNSIINDLRSCPVGTYNVPNPNCCYGPWGAMNWSGFTNSGCGCA